ncbi:helix-turn-helix domain-containing protein [Haloferax volcanii]|uniref:Bat-like protein n=2 Tax=Haloferax volcanii TaxID=2246 RepID=A0A384LLS2_HALVD|nr:Bat-like protein [Haloferax volcanii DS2]MBS8120597.1 helix-turn-helix domain-containing protein [Haloferax volcanii]MBS8125634.1 helix-turn-helix domain-containing protein [Haloferax volcanii]MBS8129643.1 helix-turn-helix domain-containing protein [Haloferax volcanii]MBS8133508.1 helix-turn-helix domain-containing protein [Haloferax volcanii]
MAREGAQGVRVCLDIWHPDCWTLQVTAETSGGLLGHGVHEIDGLANGRFTAYADTVEEVDDLLAAVRESPLTESVWETDDHDGDVGVPGSAARGIVVRYDLGNSINDALVSRGFIPDEPVRMQGGRERWTVLVHETRQTVHERRGDSSGAKRRHRRGTHHRPRRRRRHVPDRRALRTPARGVELARRRGYYSWPREVSAASLAAELDISKATLLEHLRRAESKLLGDY